MRSDDSLKLGTRDKVVQKMTKDGAELENLSKGSSKRISSRLEETDLGKGDDADKTGRVEFGGRGKNPEDNAEAEKKARKRRQQERANEELREKSRTVLKHKTEERLKESERVSSYKSESAKMTVDTPKQKKSKLRHHGEALSDAVHNKVDEETDDNTGVEAAHRTEETAEAALERLTEKPTSKLQTDNGRRTTSKLQEKKQSKAAQKLSFESNMKMSKPADEFVRTTGFQKQRDTRHKLRFDHVERKSGLSVKYGESEKTKQQTGHYRYTRSKYFEEDGGKGYGTAVGKNTKGKEVQKRQLKREYASAYRNKRRGIKGTNKPGGAAGGAAWQAVSEKEKEAVMTFFSEHKAIILIAMFFFLVLIIMLTSVGTVGTALLSSGESFVQSTYLSSDDAITSANDTYAALEDALHDKIDRVPQDYPGYDEYRYDLDDFNYDPYVLTSYLTAVYKDYELSDVQAELNSLFDAQYTLTLTSIVETRYDSEGNPYDWHVLIVSLTNNGLENVVTGRMDEDQKKAYDLYQENKGNRSYLFGDGTGGAGGAGGVPAGLDYAPTDEALLDERFAGMIREAEKYLGYPYVWGGSSPSTSFDCSGFVSWVINHSGNGWNVGRQTANGLVGCTARVTDPKPGDLIFFQGTYNTSGASHVGIVVDPEQKIMIHCGNPIQYASYDTSYWRQHFLSYGRLP